jgi:hypothetical protein
LIGRFNGNVQPTTYTNGVLTAWLCYPYPVVTPPQDQSAAVVAQIRDSSQTILVQSQQQLVANQLPMPHTWAIPQFTIPAGTGSTYSVFLFITNYNNIPNPSTQFLADMSRVPLATLIANEVY